MKQNPLPPFPSRRRKVSVEVYFVLYLSAIVLLLGTTSTARKNDREAELEEAIVQMLAPDFRLDADKVAVIYRFLPASLANDTAGIKLTRDSINYIRARGSFSEVDFSIVAIEDSATGQQLPVESAVLRREGDRLAVFTWRPREITNNAIYRVTVAASATPLPPSNIVRPEIRDRISEILRRHRVSDSVTFTVNVVAVTNLAMLNQPQLPPTNILRDTGGSTAFLPETIRTFITPSGGNPAASMSFAPIEPVIRMVPRGAWENRLIAAGVTNPVVTSGNAQITSNAGGFITVAGVAPAVSGDQQIVVEGTGTDGRRVTAQFTVNTRPLDAPQLPQVFYPDIKYSLDFSSNGVPDKDISVDVFLNNKPVINRETVSARFNFTPPTTGQLLFVRYLGDKETGKFAVSVEPLRRPEVGNADFSREENTAYVRTTSHGYVENRKNLAELKIDEGNAEDPELVDTRTDNQTMTHTQVWRIKPRDPNRDFWFTVHAIDQRGSKDGKSKDNRTFKK